MITRDPFNSDLTVRRSGCRVAWQESTACVANADEPGKAIELRRAAQIRKAEFLQFHQTPVQIVMAHLSRSKLACLRIGRDSHRRRRAVWRDASPEISHK